MQLLVFPQSLDDIPTQPINTDPTTFDPSFLGLLKELDHGGIPKIMHLHVIL